MAGKPERADKRRLARVGRAAGAAFLYTVSLPERLIRALTATVGGALKETTDLLIPTPLKKSTLYRIFIDNLLRYGLEYIGRVEDVYPKGENQEGTDVVNKDYPVRKTVGNLLEGASIVAFQISPLWIFALGSDILKGGKAYVIELQQELAARGLAKGDIEPGNTYQLLASLEHTSQALAANVDTPPLTREALQEHGNNLKEAMGELRQAIAGSREKLQEVFEDFNQVAEQAGSKLQLAGVMTLSLSQQIQKRTMQVIVGAEVGATMFVDQVLLFYPRTLADIHKRGYAKVASAALAPYGRAAVANFKAENTTLTERLFKGVGKKMKNFLTGKGEYELDLTNQI